MDFEVGQSILFTQPLFFKNQGLVEGIVTKVGRKYVYVEKIREFKFEKTTLREITDINYEGRIYPSKEAYQDEQELWSNLEQIRDAFRRDNLKLSLEQTREILKVLADC